MSRMTSWQLDKLASFSGVQGPVVVVVMDGVGYGRNDETDGTPVPDPEEETGDTEDVPTAD